MLVCLLVIMLLMSLCSSFYDRRRISRSLSNTYVDEDINLSFELGTPCRKTKRLDSGTLFYIAVSFCFCFLFCVSWVEGRVIGVDMGDEFFKVALVAPGTPFEILLNSHSNRKTLSAVSFAETARAIGDSAYSHLSRYPTKALVHTKGLLGYNASNDEVEIEEQGMIGANGLPIEFYPYEYIKDDKRGTINVKIRDDLVLSPEEITSNLFSYVKLMAVDTEMGGRRMKRSQRIGGILTIPCSFSQRQRQAFVDAAEMAGIEVMGLVHGAAATAVQRSFDVRFDSNNTSYTYLFYDFGSKSINAAIVKYSSVNATGIGKQKESAHVQMLGCTCLSNVGGHFIDIAIARKAVEEFKLKHGIDLTQHPKAMKKLLAEAIKVKHLLSANNKGIFLIESLHDNKDIRMPIFRKDIEDILNKSGIFDKMKDHVNTVLNQTNLTIADINLIEVTGGGWRIPRIQEELSKMFHPVPLGQHLNGDDAAAMGAAFIAANYSASFKVRSVLLTDASSFSYSVHLTGLGKVADGEVSEPVDKFKELIKKGSRLFGTKTVVLKSKQDLDVSLFEDDHMISKYEIRGISEVIHKQFENLEAPKIALVFKINSSGIIKLEKAHATFEEIVVETILVNKTVSLNNTAVFNRTTSCDSSTNSTCFFNSTVDQDFGGNRTIQVEDTCKNSTNSNCTASSPTELSEPTVETKTTKKKHTVVLQLQEILAKPIPMSDEEKAEVIGRLAKQNEIDAIIARQGRARNSLESYIYNARDSLSSEESKIVSTNDERDGIFNTLEMEENWLYDNESDAAAEIYEEKLKILESRVKPITRKAAEYKVRNDTIRQMNSTLDSSLKKLGGYEKNRPWVPKDVIEIARNSTNAIRTWWNDILEKQSMLPLIADPAFTKSDVDAKVKELDVIIKIVEKIPKPKPTPKPSPPPPANNSTSESTPTSVPSSPSPNDSSSKTSATPPVDSFPDASAGEQARNIPDNESNTGSSTEEKISSDSTTQKSSVNKDNSGSTTTTFSPKAQNTGSVIHEEL